VRLFMYGIDISGNGADNLCIRIFHLLEEWFNLPSVDIHLLKTNPIGAGLGGGSADAAFCLKALQAFFHLNITDVEAHELLAKIGSDCPFFWKNKPALVFGKGDQMRPIDLDLSEYWILLIYPNLAISTKEAYAKVIPSDPVIDLNLLTDLPIETWKEVLVNDFEKSLYPAYPVLDEIKNELYNQGAIYASMSGSGSTMYGIFKEKPKLPDCFSGYQKFVGKMTISS
jgi:4-diphosphocytidyl-2-C-methyl-D-erythritol kinase